MGARILVVEDHDGSREMLCDILKSWGYICDAAASGEDACRCVMEHCPDVIISDLSMPGMSGLDLLRSIRSRNAECSRAAFFLLTGYATVEVGVNAIELGADECLVKPLNPDQLHALLETHGFHGDVQG